MQPPSSMAPSSPRISVAPSSPRISLASSLTAPSSPHTSLGSLSRPSSPVTTAVSGPATTAPEVSVLEDFLDRIHRGRVSASCYAEHRLNRAILLPNLCERIQLCKLKHQSELLCYCLRISNVEVGSSEPSVALNAILEKGAFEDWGEIVMLSIHHEVDATWSIDIGFRFVEDALVMWTRHGTRFRGRCWDIVPIQAILGIGFVAQKLVDQRRSIEERVRRLKLCESLEELFLRNQQTSYSQSACHGYRLQQIGMVLAQPAFQPHSFLPLNHRLSLQDDWADLYLDGFDTGRCYRVAVRGLLDKMHSRIALHENDWESTPLSHPTSGLFYRYQTSPYVLPRRIPRQTSPTKSSRKHARQNKKRDAGPSSSKEPTSMTSAERTAAQRNTRHIADIKRACWNSDHIPLPSLPPRIEYDFKAEMLQLWDWYEDCLRATREAYNKSGLTNTPMNSTSMIACVQQESFFAAERSFAPAARIKKVFGQDYTEIMDAVNGNRGESSSYYS